MSFDVAPPGGAPLVYVGGSTNRLIGIHLLAKNFFEGNAG
jgi:hypothetical protein